MDEKSSLKQIAIFASGSGTNAENIVKYFQQGNLARVAIILTNNKNAFVVDRAAQLNVASKVFSRDMLYHTNEIPELLLSLKTDLIVLAGFLWLVPDSLLKSFRGKIINIHPALLPKYGGKGMYGHIVHEAVLKSGDRESGITIHYINEKYDEGEIILQAKCEVNPAWSADDLAERIHELEYFHYPRVIEKILLNTDK
jgi:phosphoribosylglycinamide formyltransferase 1